MKIGDRALGPEHPLFIQVEVGVTHMGDLGRAFALIDAAAAADADAAKFIVTDPDEIMTRRNVLFTYETWPGAPDRETRPLYDLLAETRFTEAQWQQIRDYCDKRGLIFYATADHLAAVEMLERLDVPAHKLSAWDIAYRPLWEAMRATGKPVLVDVGTATREEVARAIPEDDRTMFVHAPHPHDDEDWNMSRLCGFFRRDYPVGFSSPGREAWCDFMALGGGACLLEKRLTLRRDEPAGHHHAIALEPDEFAAWVADMRRAHATLRADAFEGSAAGWAERAQWDRGPDGRRP